MSRKLTLLISSCSLRIVYETEIKITLQTCARKATRGNNKHCTNYRLISVLEVIAKAKKKEKSPDIASRWLSKLFVDKQNAGASVWYANRSCTQRDILDSFKILRNLIFSKHLRFPFDTISWFISNQHKNKSIFAMKTIASFFSSVAVSPINENMRIMCAVWIHELMDRMLKEFSSLSTAFKECWEWSKRESSALNVEMKCNKECAMSV